MKFCFLFRSQSQSGSSSSFEKNFGVCKETLLHGSYADYIKEYAARSSRTSQVSWVTFNIILCGEYLGKLKLNCTHDTQFTYTTHSILGADENMWLNISTPLPNSHS